MTWLHDVAPQRPQVRCHQNVQSHQKMTWLHDVAPQRSHVRCHQKVQSHQKMTWLHDVATQRPQASSEGPFASEDDLAPRCSSAAATGPVVDGGLSAEDAMIDDEGLQTGILIISKASMISLAKRRLPGTLRCMPWLVNRRLMWLKSKISRFL
ncbi:hypothetical protein J6590_103893 [Homalodisca vitripennis]|nr:hypothetical protein J6590_103893 [Homalodisca vitripennis]